jgi:hypothetical protein
MSESSVSITLSPALSPSLFNASWATALGRPPNRARRELVVALLFFFSLAFSNQFASLSSRIATSHPFFIPSAPSPLAFSPARKLAAQRPLQLKWSKVKCQCEMSCALPTSEQECDAM